MNTLINRAADAHLVALEEAGWSNQIGADPFDSFANESDDFGGVSPDRCRIDGFHITTNPYWTSKVHEAEVAGEYAQTVELATVNVSGRTTDPAMRDRQEDMLAVIAARVRKVCEPLEGAELASALEEITARIADAAAQFGDAILLGRTLRAELRAQNRRVNEWRAACVRAAITEAFGDELTARLVEVLRDATPVAPKATRRSRSRNRHNRSRRNNRRS